MWGVYAAILAVLDLKRTCPKCGKSQVVRLERRRKVVKCKHCGADVPVPRERPGSFS